MTMQKSIIAVISTLIFTLISGCTTISKGAPGNILMLGEIHDNPDGHAQRFESLKALVDGGWRPAIAMEQFDRESQGKLTEAQAKCKNADCLIDLVGRSKWEWKYYNPLIELALNYRLPLIAANLSRKDASLIVRGGIKAAMDSETIARFGLDKPLPTNLLKAQSTTIITGHCGMLPASIVPGMVDAQVARDVWMAKTIIDNQANGVVLIAGNGHVRRDIGVARWLPVALAESAEIHGYVERDSTIALEVYDVIHRVKAHQRPDPCASFIAPLPATNKN